MNDENNKTKMIEKTNKDKNIKKTKLLKTIFIVSGTIGVILILYPIYTNFIAGSRETAVLSAWEDQKEEYFEKVEAGEEISDETDTEQTSQTANEDIDDLEENEEVTRELTGDIAG